MALELTKYFPKSEDEKLLLKEKYFGSTEVQTFGFVGENNISSDLGILLIAFAKLKLKIIEANQKADEFNALEEKPEGMEDTFMAKLDTPKLLLKTNTIGSIDILNLCDVLQLEVSKDVVICETSEYTKEEENDIYNALDFFITVSNGDNEGWSVIKAMATKTLVICPKHTVFEKLGNSVNYVFREEFVYPNDKEVLRYISQSTEVAHVCKTMMALTPEEKEKVKEIVEHAYSNCKQ